MHDETVKFAFTVFINQDQFCYKLQLGLNWLQQARPSVLSYRSGWDPKRLKQTMQIHHWYTQPCCRASNRHLASTKRVLTTGSSPSSHTILSHFHTLPVPTADVFEIHNHTGVNVT